MYPRSSRTDAGIARTVIAAGVAALVVLLGGGTALVLAGSSGASSPSATPTLANGSPSPDPITTSLTSANAVGSTVPWNKPLSVSVVDGTLQTVTTTVNPGGAVLAGTLTDALWTSTDASLIPGRSYVVAATVKNAQGKTESLTHTYTASAAGAVLHATVFPGNGSVVGIAQPVVVKFDQKVKGHDNRLAVLQRLQVASTPSVEGAWRWYNSYEIHYRPAKYWQSGTKINVHVNLGLIHLVGGGVWGTTKTLDRTFTIGKDYSSVVDIAKHIMVVRLDGKVIRTIKVSTGRDQYPTKGGVHIVLTRETKHIYNSDTVGIPRNGPGGYYETLPWSMRISNGGAFVHANPATVGVQGRRNVSHGCVNTSVTDAKWFYYHSQLGDPVNIINAVVKPVISDAGMYDWNIPFADWSKGNLDG